MKSTVIILSWLADNYLFLIIVIALIIAIVYNIIGFFKLTDNEKKAVIKKQAASMLECAKSCVGKLVAEAEEKWGSNYGPIKKSHVFNAILKLLPDISTYIEGGYITSSQVEDIIDKCVAEMNERFKDTAKSGQLFSSEKGADNENKVGF